MDDWLQIPGDIKQQYVPFTLTGSSSLQCFTFKNAGQTLNKDGTTVRQINICPKQFNIYMANDIGNKQNNLTDNSILSVLPAIQIREYLPDAKLDQVINFMQSAKEGFDTAMQDGKDSNTKDKNFKKNWDKRVEEKGGTSYTWAKIQVLTKKMWSIFKDGTWYKDLAARSNAVFPTKGKNTDDFILSFPYILYYRLLSTQTTNIYEVPFNPKELYKSMGQNGWEANQKYGFDGTSKNSIVGKMLNMIAPNITINCSPVWKPGSYDNLEVAVSFDLFNDNADSALVNFIMVNTLFPNNMWMQYHIYQHSPDLYDVKIEGFNRLFMCSGNFTCEAKGVMRQMPQSMIDKLNKEYLNKSTYNKFDGDNLFKIPDVYHIVLNFKSLLPNNFNNYLYSYTNNKCVIENGKGHQESVYSDLAKIVGQKIQKLKEYWKGDQIEKDMEENFNGTKK